MHDNGPICPFDFFLFSSFIVCSPSKLDNFPFKPSVLEVGGKKRQTVCLVLRPTKNSHNPYKTRGNLTRPQLASSPRLASYLEKDFPTGAKTQKEQIDPFSLNHNSPLDVGRMGSICHFSRAFPASIWGHCSRILVFASILEHTRKQVQCGKLAF